MYPGIQDLFQKRFKREYKDQTLSLFVLVRVEAGLHLLEILGLQNHSVLTVWALLQGLEIPALRALPLSAQQQQWWANYRVILHQTSLADWQDDLEIYASYPAEQRVYVIPETSETYSTQPVVRTGHQGQRLADYDEVFGQVLPFKRDKRSLAGEGTYSYPVGSQQWARVDFTAEVLARAPRAAASKFGGRRTPQPLSYTYAQLRELAQEVEALEAQQGIPPGYWVHRVEHNLRYRARRADGALAEANAEPLRIKGMTHIAGMVGAGKSTVADLIAFDIARQQSGQRVTLIFADVAETLRKSNYFNRLLGSVAHAPVAVPLLGPSMRAKHLHTLFQQQDFALTEDHWQLRYLDTTCLITQWLKPIDESTEAQPAGQEPCTRLSPAQDGNAARQKTHLCPLFGMCPMHQAYHDMPAAPIWVTTAGALGQANVLPQVDGRQIPLWVLIYENSDLVVFDEVDAIQLWFDSLFAPDVVLDDAQTAGLLQRSLREISNYPSATFRNILDLDRWRQHYDMSMPAARNLLGMLEHAPDLQRWLGKRPFTALRVLFELAARLSGRFLWDNPERNEDEAEAQAPPEIVETLYTELHALFLNTLRTQVQPPSVTEPSSAAIQVLQSLTMQIMWLGRSESHAATRLGLEQWIQQTLARLPEEIRARVIAKHSIAALARRLELGLVTAVLDQRLRGLFYGWHIVQQILGENEFPAFIPNELIGILPTPPLGRRRGFRTTETAPGGSLSLATFEYAAVGRYFVRRFDRLLTALDGRPGPNVLAMSGTSWMPDSSRYHFAVPPVGILEPTPVNQEAVRHSQFFYLPQWETTPQGESRLLRISGSGEALDENLQKVADALASKPDQRSAPLAREMDRLQRLAQEDPAHWEDRARLLLVTNSYEQARHVAQRLSSLIRSDLQPVYALVRSDHDTDLWEMFSPLKRSEVESAAQRDARILVAPLNAIGRAYNIVSPITKKAAYGAIFFLIRPMTPPFDTLAMVAEINHALDEWLQVEGPLARYSATTPYAQMSRLREIAHAAWEKIERGKVYKALDTAGIHELGATTASAIIQACGRLVRGGVPFHAFFVDGAWVGYQTTNKATPRHSLLAASIERLVVYARTPEGQALYGAFCDGLQALEGVELDLSSLSS